MANTFDKYIYSEETSLEKVKYDTKDFSEQDLDRYQYRLLEYVRYSTIFIYYKVPSPTGM